MSIIANNLLQGDEGYNISRSLRLRSSASAYLNRTISTDGSLRKGTFSFWIKRANNRTDGEPDNIYQSANTGDNNYRAFLNMGTNGGTASLQIYAYDSAGNLVLNIATSAVYRDPSSWYHIVFAFDTTQATSSDRAKVYVNGVQQTALSSATYPSQNTDLGYFKNLSSGTYIGANRGGASPYASCYLTEYNVVDGQALTPSSFGETDLVTGVWKAKKYGGTYGTNGFYLPFSDNTSTTTLGYDQSGNSNNWTTNNISLTAGSTYDSMVDVPTMSALASNYPTANPLMNLGGIVTLSNGNLTATKSGNGDYIIPSTMAIPAGTGKWYWEVTATTISASSNFSLGIVKDTIGTGAWGASSPSAVFWNGSSGSRQAYNSASTGTSWSVASGDILGLALDATTGNFSLYKNNTLVETWSAIVNTTFAHFVFASSYANSEAYSYNFGQRPFSYTPPTGFVALNTFNLPEPSIKAGNKHMDATIYTGNGTTRTIANAGGFYPDLSWIKARNDTSWNQVFDSVRGALKGIYTNDSYQETTQTDSFTAFTSTGFTLGADAAGGSVNKNANTYVAWQWKAGQGTTSSNTAGSITSTVSANPTAGFSVVTYTGLNAGGTIGHGLGVAPQMVIFKNRTSGTTNWRTYHNALGTANYVNLNTTAASANDSGWFGASSSTLNLNGGNDYCSTGSNYVAYCFAQIAGYSAFGSYTGNGSTDGAFVHLGFRPKYIMIKRTDTTNNWHIYDTTRTPYNLSNLALYADLNLAEGTETNNVWDLLSNGFKARAGGNGANASGGTYIYMAFAETPFKYSLAR